MPPWLSAHFGNGGNKRGSWRLDKYGNKTIDNRFIIARLVVVAPHSRLRARVSKRPTF